MSLEDRIIENTVAIEKLIGTIKNYSFIPSTASTSNPVQEKSKRTRRTKAEIEADKKTDPCSLSLDSAPPTETEVGIGTKSDPLDILDTPQPEVDKNKITEEKLRMAATELVEVSGRDSQEGLKIAQELIKKLGFETLASVTEDKYKKLYDAFKLAVKTWKK